MIIYGSELLKKLEEDDIFPAHIRRKEDGDAFEIQTVFEHNSKTAELAGKSLQETGLYATAYVTGLLHDIGKLTGSYRKYIVRAASGKDVVRGSVNHTFAGVRLILREYHGDSSSSYERLTAELIAYAVGAHHGQFDLIDEHHEEDGFDHRLNEKNFQDDEIEGAIERFRKSEYYDTLRELFPKCVEEIKAVYDKLSFNRSERWFYLGLIARLLLSAVVEGDRTNTAAFMSGSMPEIDEADWGRCLSYFEARLSELPSDTDIAKARDVLSERCKSFATKPSGIYRLSLPTGSGKTLTSLRYALTHAEKNNKKRIIFVIPLLAIIDQNARVIEDYIGDSCRVLEHHSNVVSCDENGREALDERELMVESWNAPIIITTLVQMLNTMFSDKTSSVRRFGSLCDSVIIFDEVQTVPTKMLSLFNQTIAFLSEICGADIILCSATQPALGYTQRPLLPEPKEMVERDEEIWNVFKRTSIVRKNNPEMSCEEIADFGREILGNSDSLLIVCNKKAEAATIYKEFRAKNESGASCFHLSSSMCMAHRRDILEAAERAKNSGKVVLSSTQVLEAGVDVSYGSAIRIQAGMDSVVQTAGRCNRNGESRELANVYIVKLKGESLNKLPDIKKGKEATNAILESKKFADFASDEAISEYYRKYYGKENAGYQDFAVEVGVTKTYIYSLLSSKPHKYILTQSFKTAGSLFRVFDDEGIDVIVPYGGNESLIEELYKCGEYDIARVRELLRKLKPYTVSLFRWQFDRISEQGGITTTPSGVNILGKNWYDDELGVVTDDNGQPLFA
ncbi:MAG: CRISPR-associated helicase Cas3' [Oscillospiraceae bacterium]|nr:CRISPR-associated helicase Cas3' [Oscillospiraceae bacterium]